MPQSCTPGGEKLKNLLCCFESEPSWFKYWDYSLFVYLTVSLLLFVWIWLLWLEQKKKNPRRLDGCLLASMFVCLQIVNNKLSPPSLSMIGPWGMWPHLWEKIIRTAVQSGWESPSVCFQKQHCTKTVLCSWCYPRLDIYVSASAQ